MFVEAGIHSDKCKFEECKHYEDGHCTDEAARQDCVDIALAVLNIDETKRKKYRCNPHCDFCSFYSLRDQVIKDRCERINKKAHVKTAVARNGVILHSYVTDHRKKVYELQSKTFPKLRFCPQCGFDYQRGCKYDVDNYKKNDKK